ncbi:hypothetical protein N7468_006546 [Penicillium chermesinum]|uniref:Cep57 centrosome microtubule-binding domain-containing protein n=1 Tax=Penicillium chermesinum TaxID=63820 RepID=A0A9W9TJQ8_9EURO|nr:uncharacterized protein N7468_006546 [Penicillium chermesinum]KAJ5225321.1 hypothetical protein N7468_006546 [Penicillium chermesinum]
MPLPDASLTLSDFDPEHEALASTREFGSPQLPNTYQHAQDEQDDPDWDIHTSTLDKAFPDFSQLSPSEDEMDNMSDSNSDISLELGRGVNKPARRLDDSRSSIMSFQNSVRSSSPAVRIDYPTPQKAGPARSTARRAVSENLRKDAQLRRANQAQKEILASPQVSKNQRDHRRTLSEMHAKVRDDYDGSFLGDERPAPIDVKPRSTRFGNRNSSQEIADAVERASRDAYAKETRKSSVAGTPRRVASGQTNVNNMGDTVTRNSFLLPDLPNISELVSGVYEDGTPVFSRNRVRSTRFVSPNDATDVSLTREHFLSMLSQSPTTRRLYKVAELEMYKSDAEKRLEHFREENAALKAGRSRHPEKYAFDADSKKVSKRSVSETQSKLEAENIALQNQLDIADRKSQVQEAAVKRLNQDKESAISQLGVAYLETRELKAENEALRAENAELRSQISRYAGRKSHEQDVESEASVTGSDVDDSQGYTERSGDMSRSTKDLTAKSSRSNLKSRRRDDSRARVSTQVEKEISRLEKERAEEELFSINVPTPKRPSASKSAKSGTKTSKKQPNTSKQRIKRVVVEDASEPLEATEQSKTASADAIDLTLLSVVDESELSRLRKSLEEERNFRKQRRSSAPREPPANETVNSTRQSILKAPLPRKSSLREPKVAIPRPASAAGDITTRSIATSEGDNSLVVPTADRPRRHSDHSVASIASVAQHKKRRNIEDMTSAFILPDITLGRAELAASNPSRLPESAQRALDGVAQHNGKNCMVCKNVLPHDGACNHEPVKVPKPVPVSERMPKPSIYNEEPTMRPSQSPAVALANVLKALEDELAHLKMQLASYQSAFNKLDASLGKKQRKALMEKIELILREIDMKSDQIYSLFDVLESHRNVKEMTEQEMEMTLESIGIDANVTGGDITGTSKSSHPIDLDDDLPWEGIESTAEITGRT